MKTEHNGSKKGCGAHWGRKAEAKSLSKKVRRLTDKKSVKEVTENNHEK